MAITPTTTIVASPQAGIDRFFFWQIGNDLENDWGSGPAGIFQNGSDQYVVLFHCVNFGALSDNQHWQYSVFRNGVQQDAANEPLVINPSANPTKLYDPNTERHSFTLYRDGINVVRATVPITDTLPASWSIETVHPPGGATSNIQGMRLFKVGTDLVLPYTGLTSGGAGTQISCAVWDGATWTDEATLASPLTVLMVRGTNGQTNAIITYDFTATATDVAGTNNLGGVSNEIFSFVSLTEPDCEVPPPPSGCTITVLPFGPEPPPFCIIPPAIEQEVLALVNEPLENQGT